MIKYLIFILVLSVLASCTITKPVHRKGWHVEWHKKRKVSETLANEEQFNLQEENREHLQTQISSTTNSIGESKEISRVSTISNHRSEELEINSEKLNKVPKNHRSLTKALNDDIRTDNATTTKSPKLATESDDAEIKKRTAISPIMGLIILLIVGTLAFLAGLGLYFLTKMISSTFLLILTFIGISIFWLIALYMVIASIVILFISRSYDHYHMAPAYGNEEELPESNE